MAEIQVKNHSLPTRCEVCHQADLFDAERGYCSRCGNIENLATTTIDAAENLTTPDQNISYLIPMLILIAAYLLIAVIGFLFTHNLIYSVLSSSFITIFLCTLLPDRIFLPSSINIDAHYRPIKHHKDLPINLEQITQHTTELEAMGFINCGDYQTEITLWSKRFIRIFYYPKQGYFIEVSQEILEVPIKPPVQIFIASFLDRGELLMTFNYKIESLIYQMGPPILFSYPGMATNQLLEKHHEAEQQLARANIYVVTDVSLSAYLERITGIYRTMAQQRCNWIPLAIVLYHFWYNLSPKKQSLGSYREVFQKTTKTTKSN